MLRGDTWTARRLYFVVDNPVVKDLHQVWVLEPQDLSHVLRQPLQCTRRITSAIVETVTSRSMTHASDVIQS